MIQLEYGGQIRTGPGKLKLTSFFWGPSPLATTEKKSRATEDTPLIEILMNSDHYKCGLAIYGMAGLPSGVGHGCTTAAVGDAEVD